MLQGEPDPAEARNVAGPFGYQSQYRSSDTMPLLSFGPSAAAAATPAWQPSAATQISMEHSPAGWPQVRKQAFRARLFKASCAS